MKGTKELKVGDKLISDHSPVFIIAEAGVNHGGDLDLARKLIDIAADAGADAVKFQAFRTEHLILNDIKKAPYQTKTTEKEESQTEMLKKLELAKEQYVELKEYCSQKGIVFLITPFDEYSLKELEEIGVDAYKVASTDTTNLPFLKKIASTSKPVILSTGMCYLDEVKKAVEEVLLINDKLILLQCTANYPISDEEANLNVITTYKDKFDCLIGYSDHSVGLGASLFAIPMGACVVEKHFTLDKNLEGPDHLASLDPDELKEYVATVRRIEKYLGSFMKEPTTSERATRKSLQKCLVASKPIKAGEIITEDHIVAKRTGGFGISPINYKEIIGKPSKKSFDQDEVIDV